MTKEVIDAFMETQKAFTDAARSFAAVVGHAHYVVQPVNEAGYVTVIVPVKYWNAVLAASAAADKASTDYVTQYREDNAAK
jgi:hypothetical protein